MESREFCYNFILRSFFFLKCLGFFSLKPTIALHFFYIKKYQETCFWDFYQNFKTNAPWHIVDIFFFFFYAIILFCSVDLSLVHAIFFSLSAYSRLLYIFSCFKSQNREVASRKKKWIFDRNMTLNQFQLKYKKTKKIWRNFCFPVE